MGEGNGVKLLLTPRMPPDIREDVLDEERLHAFLPKGRVIQLEKKSSSRIDRHWQTPARLPPISSGQAGEIAHVLPCFLESLSEGQKVPLVDWGSLAWRDRASGVAICSDRRRGAGCRRGPRHWRHEYGHLPVGEPDAVCRERL